MAKKSLTAILIASVVHVFFLSCSNNVDTTQADNKFLDTTASVYGPYRLIKLPITKGVTILNPIQLQLGPGGKVFAANQSGEIYTLEDSDNDGIEDEAFLYCNIADFNLRSPAGFAHKGDTIYIGTAQEIRIFLDRNKDGKADTSWTFFKDVPYSQHPYEWTCGLDFGPDGWLYFDLSTDSWNAGASPDPNKYRGAILRVSPDGKQVERLATGIRSVYSMKFNEHGDLFFIDNEGGGNPKEELNRYVKGAFYGHNPLKYEGHDSAIGPDHALETEVAPSGIVFNGASNDFGGTAGNLFVSFYGPGERWKRGGVGRIKMERQSDGSYHYEEFPVADIPKLSAIAFGKDGSLYLAHHGLSDYWYNSTEEKTGGFYKLVYDESLKDIKVKSRNNKSDVSANSIEEGRILFGQSACSACHSVDGKTELLGPDLKGVGKKLSREDILEEIQSPSKIIKPSMGAVRITKKDGQVLLGRILNADEKELSMILVGNKIVKIPRDEIAKSENEKKSLMFENLIKNRSEKDIKNLLDYIMSLE